MASFIIPALKMCMLSSHLVVFLIRAGRVILHIFWRSISNSLQPNRCVFHQKNSRASCEAHATCTFDVVFFWGKYKPGESNDIAYSPLQMLIEDSILASGVLSVGLTLLEEVTVIFLAPSGAHKQATPHVLAEGRESPREAATQAVAIQCCFLLLQHLH